MSRLLTNCVPGIIMFHMMWNRIERETAEYLTKTLRQALPESWQQIVVQPKTESGSIPDLLLEVKAPDGSRTMLVIEVKRNLDPKDVPRILNRTRSYAKVTNQWSIPVICAPFLSPRTREYITELGGNYADLTGNLRLVMENPAVFIEKQGAKKNPNREKRVLASLRGSASGRVVRALCDFKPPFGIRQLAKRARSSPASVSRVANLLDREALITREPNGKITAVQWQRVLRRWTQEYAFATSNRTRAFLEARGLSALDRKLQKLSTKFAVTGSQVATKVAPIAPPRLATLYVEDIGRAAEDLEIRPAETGANVVLAEPFDSVVFDRTRQQGGVVYAAYTQVVADLLTGPGRSPAEAEALIVWMERNEQAWRS